MKGVFVTGTDTGVGKTLASAALLHALRRRHARVVGMKPVAAGAVRLGTGWTSEDAQALRSASSVTVPAGLDNPVLLPMPVSPHLAAQRAGVEISIDAIVRSYRQLARHADMVVVEGAGGFLVPLGDHATGADLAHALGLPVVLVVGLRLGCLNHALLTEQAIRARGLVLAGWICNRIDPDMLLPEENAACLRDRLGAPMLADIPHQPRPDANSPSMILPPDWP